GLRHMRLQPAFAVPARELAVALGEGLRLAPGEIAPEDADDGRALEQRQVEWQLRNLAGGEADDEQPPTTGERTEGRLRIRANDRVVHDVDAFAVGQRLDALAQILRRVIDRGVGAMVAADGKLVLARGAGDHA